MNLFQFSSEGQQGDRAFNPRRLGDRGAPQEKLMLQSCNRGPIVAALGAKRTMTGMRNGDGSQVGDFTHG